MRLRPYEKDLSKVDFDSSENGSEIFSKRIEFANNLSNLIKNIDDGITISIDAKWGEGKTLFLKLLEKRLIEDKDKKIDVIYFDAFKNDFFENPFVPIALEIQNKYKDQRKLIEKFTDSSTEILQTLYHRGGDIALKIVTLGTIGKKEIDTLTKDTLEAVSEGSSILLETQKLKCEDYVELKKSMDNLKEALKEIVKKDNNSKLVFLIDELDRCEPGYAIKVFEVIKHFFEADGVTFVLAMNKEQISKYFEGKCGNGAENYLQKFINFECVLPIDKSDSHLGDITKFGKILYKYHLDSMNEKTTSYKKLQEIDIETINSFFSYYKLTLREIEDFFRNFILTVSFYNGFGHFHEYQITAIFLIFKIKYPKLFDYIKQKDRSQILENLIIPACPESAQEFSYKFMHDIPNMFFHDYTETKDHFLTLEYFYISTRQLITKPVQEKMEIASRICKTIDLEL